MDIKLKDFNGKVFVNKSLMFNTLFILIMFTISQIIGIYLCIKLFSGNLSLMILVLALVNFIFYKNVIS